LNEVTWEQRAEGDPGVDVTQRLPPFPYAEYGRMLGLHGIRVDLPEGIAPAWEHALSADRPTVLEVVVDPNVPPLPPHIPWKQARAYFGALRKDDERSAVLRSTLRQWWAGRCARRAISCQPHLHRRTAVPRAPGALAKRPHRRRATRRKRTTRSPSACRRTPFPT